RCCGSAPPAPSPQAAPPRAPRPWARRLRSISTWQAMTRPGLGPALRTALDCLVAASMATRSNKLDTDELGRGFRALMLALVAHAALRQSRGQCANTAPAWLREIAGQRSGRDPWSTLLDLLEQESRDLAPPLRRVLDPVPMRACLRRRAINLD